MRVPRVPSGCTERNAHGAPCGMPAGKNGRCFAHDPERAAERAAARTRGGRNRRTGRAAGTADGHAAVSLRSVDDVLRALEDAVADTQALENSAARSRALGGLLGVALQVLKVGEIDERVAALEERLAAMNALPPRRIA